MAIAATILAIAYVPSSRASSAIALAVSSGEGALVALQRRARVGVLGVAEEQAQDLRDIVLVNAEVHEPFRVSVTDRLVLRAAQPELRRDPPEIREPARPKRGVAPDVEHHLVGRQRLVAAFDVTHRTRPSGSSDSP